MTNITSYIIHMVLLFQSGTKMTTVPAICCEHVDLCHFIHIRITITSG